MKIYFILPFIFLMVACQTNTPIVETDNFYEIKIAVPKNEKAKFAGDQLNTAKNDKIYLVNLTDQKIAFCDKVIPAFLSITVNYKTILACGGASTVISNIEQFGTSVAYLETNNLIWIIKESANENK